MYIDAGRDPSAAQATRRRQGVDRLRELYVKYLCGANARAKYLKSMLSATLPTGRRRFIRYMSTLKPHVRTSIEADAIASHIGSSLYHCGVVIVVKVS